MPDSHTRKRRWAGLLAAALLAWSCGPSDVVAPYQALSVSTSGVATGVQGAAYAQLLEAAGGDGDYTWSLTAGALPAGLLLDGSAGQISGLPTQIETQDFTVQVASGDGQTAQVELSLSVYGDLAVTTSSLSFGVVGVAYAASLSGTGGGGGYTWTVVDGALPDGLTLNGASGAILGVPTTASSQSPTFALASGDGQTEERQLTISVTEPTALADDVPVAGVGAVAGEAAYFVFDVPAAAPRLEVSTSGGSGDVDLYVRQGAIPTTANADCESTSPTSAELCGIESPAAGPWYVMLYGFGAFSGVSVNARVAAACSLSSLPDSDGDRLPDCVETNTGTFVSDLDTGTDPTVADTDGDAIEDGDEVLGTEGGLDLPGLGVDPLVPTVLIEYDWFDDAVDAPAHSHRPTAAQLAMVTASFAARGVQVIHDYGQGPAPFTGGNLIVDVDGDDNISGDLNGEFLDYKATHFAADRTGYFHYALLPHRYNGGNSSGLAEVNGNDLIVATLTFFGNALAVAGTVQHELGHNLGLGHGGPGDPTNHKPNYPSVMNYNYQFTGVDDDCDPIGDGVLDYSSGLNPDLDENDLDETLGVCGGSPPWDWNEDGDEVDMGIAVDINRRWTTDDEGDGTLEVLEDRDDWGNLYFGGINGFDGAPYGVAPVSSVEVCPVPPEEILHPGGG